MAHGIFRHASDARASPEGICFGRATAFSSSRKAAGATSRPRSTHGPAVRRAECNPVSCNVGCWITIWVAMNPATATWTRAPDARPKAVFAMVRDVEMRGVVRSLLRLVAATRAPHVVPSREGRPWLVQPTTNLLWANGIKRETAKAAGESLTRSREHSHEKYEPQVEKTQ